MAFKITFPKNVPADFNEWQNRHFKGQAVRLVPFTQRQPAPNLRRQKIEQLAKRLSFENILKKIKF